MSNDILVLNEAGEEIPEEHAPLTHEEHEDHDEEQTTPSYKQQRSGKKGFRIDDILFSVSNNVLRNPPCLSVVSNSPLSSASSICSSNSSHTSMDEMSPVLYLHDNDTPPCKDKEKSRITSPPTMMTRTRSRSLSPTLVHSSSNYGHQCSEGMSLYSPSANDTKKPRTSFSPDQIQVLEDSFQEKRYLNHTERMILAEELNLTDCQIKTWFQNRRMKMKRQYKEAVDKGYLIPYHPYPFPRYSRLTPAHFASLPTLNARRFFGKQNTNRPYPPSSSGSSGGCHCCSNSRSYSSSRDYMRSHLSSCTQVGCSDYLHNKSNRRGPEVLPCRSVERRDMRYDSEFNEYFRHLPSKPSASSDNVSSSNSALPTSINITDRNKKFP